MDKKRSIQDIKPANSLNQKLMSDIININEKPTKKKVKKLDIEQEPENIAEDIDITPVLEDDTQITKPKRNKIKKIFRLIREIKPFYLITFIIIIVGILVLIFVPSGQKDPNAQAKKEAEMVKKELSKHMVLPKDEQIDIRKITNKMDDPFFKDAEIGDYLIIFYKNRIAHIYSIKKDLIINTGVVFIDPKTATTTNKTQ